MSGHNPFRVALARNGLPSVARGLATLGFETQSLRDWRLVVNPIRLEAAPGRRFSPRCMSPARCASAECSEGDLPVHDHPAATKPAMTARCEAGCRLRRFVDRNRSPIARCVRLGNNPKGWQRVAGGGIAANTPGDSVLGFGILKGCQKAATPGGSVRNLGTGSRGYRCAQPPATFWQASGLQALEG
jgi:hypothetical protein